MIRLSESFFARDTNLVARELLGKQLVHQIDGEQLSGKIVEVEVYTGWEDEASHGHRGKTARNAPMFGEVGMSYIYLIYGRYWLMNVIAKPPGVDYPAAILIRALEPTSGLTQMALNRKGQPEKEWTNGPGRLTLALGIDGRHNNISLIRPDSLIFFEDAPSLSDDEIATGARIGLGKDINNKWRMMPLRYFIAENSKST